MARPSKLAFAMLLAASLARLACKGDSVVDAGEATSVSAEESARKLAKIRQERDKAKREVEEAARVAEAQKRAARARIEKQAADASAIEPATGGAGVPRDRGEQEIDGRLQAVGPNWISVRDGSGFEYMMRMDDHTHVIAGGKLEDLKELPQGSRVRVGVALQGKRRIARDIQIVELFAHDAR